eukprot:6208482-Pleurochrysis_carterae.AAC.4
MKDTSKIKAGSSNLNDRSIKSSSLDTLGTIRERTLLVPRAVQRTMTNNKCAQPEVAGAGAA